MIRPTLVLTASLFIYACGGGGSSDSADETGAENNPEIGNTDDSIGGTDNPEDSANLPDETDTDNGDADNGIGDDTGNTGNSGNNSQLIGVWARCTLGMLGEALEFNETTYRFYFAAGLENECSDLLTLERSTQGGTYQVVGNSTSEEGLPVLQVEFDVMDIFGGIDDNGAAPNAFNIIHVDGDTLFWGFAGGTLEQVGPNLNFENTFIRVR